MDTRGNLESKEEHKLFLLMKLLKAITTAKKGKPLSLLIQKEIEEIKADEEKNVLEDKLPIHPPLDRGITSIMNLSVAEFQANPRDWLVLFRRDEQLCDEMGGFLDSVLKKEFNHISTKRIVGLKGNSPTGMATAILKKSIDRHYPYMEAMRDTARSRVTIAANYVEILVARLETMGKECGFEVKKVLPRHDIIDPKTNKPMPGMYGYPRFHLVFSFPYPNDVIQTAAPPFECQLGPEEVEFVYELRGVPIAEQLMSSYEITPDLHDFSYKIVTFFLSHPFYKNTPLGLILQKFQDAVHFALAKAGHGIINYDELYQLHQKAGEIFFTWPSLLRDRQFSLFNGTLDESVINKFGEFFADKRHGEIVLNTYYLNLVDEATEQMLIKVLRDQKKLLFIPDDSLKNLQAIVEIAFAPSPDVQFKTSLFMCMVMDNPDSRNPLSDKVRQRLEIIRAEKNSLIKKIESANSKYKKITYKWLIENCKKFSDVICYHQFEQSHGYSFLPGYHVNDKTIYFLIPVNSQRHNVQTVFDHNGNLVSDSQIQNAQFEYLKTQLTIFTAQYPDKNVEGIYLCSEEDANDRVKEIEQQIALLNCAVRVRWFEANEKRNYYSPKDKIIQMVEVFKQYEKANVEWEDCAELLGELDRLVQNALAKAVKHKEAKERVPLMTPMNPEIIPTKLVSVSKATLFPANVATNSVQEAQVEHSVGSSICRYLCAWF